MKIARDKAAELDPSSFSNSPFFKALGIARDVMLKMGEAGLPVEKVGELVHQALTSPRPKVRYAISNQLVEP